MPGTPYWSSVSPHTGRGTQHTRQHVRRNFFPFFPRQRKVLHDQRQAPTVQRLRRALGHFQDQRRLREVAHQLSPVSFFPFSFPASPKKSSSYIVPSLVINKVCSTFCCANPPRRPSRPRSPSGPQKSSRRSCSSGTSVPRRCALSRRWTRRRTGYTKRTSTRYS